MITVPVHRRFSDLDPLGHVNNVAYHDYLQEARVGLIGELSLVSNAEYAQIVVRQEIRHRRPLGYAREPVLIDVWISEMARTSYTVEYRIRDEAGEIAAEATSLLAVVDAETGRPVRIPDEVKDALERSRPA